MTDLKSSSCGGSRDESKQSPRLAAMQRRREKRAVPAAKEDEKGLSKEEDQLGEATEAERVSKARKMVEVSEAPKRWLEIREAMRKEKELRLEMKTKMEMEEIKNPKMTVPPPPPPVQKTRKRSGARRSSSSGSTSRSRSRSQLLIPPPHPLPSAPPPALLQPLQSTTQDHLFLQPTPPSQLAWPQGPQMLYQLDTPSQPRPSAPPTTLQLFPEAPPPEKQQRSLAARDRTSCAPRVAVTRINGEMLTGCLKTFHSVNEIFICCDCHNKMFTAEGFLNHAGWTVMWGDDPTKYIMMLDQ